MLEIKVAIVILSVVFWYAVIILHSKYYQQKKEKTALIFAQAPESDIDNLLWKTDAIKEMQEIADKYGIKLWKDSMIGTDE
jgi:predicted membrane protein